MSSPPTLVTPRLELKPASLNLLEGLLDAVATSIAELRVWMPWAVTYDPDGTRAFLERAEREWAEGNDRHFVVVHEEDVGGVCSLDHADPLNNNFEIGYWMRSDLCGKGLMTEAASAVVSYGFETLATHRIQLNAGTENLASIRIAEKLGFRREGVLREAGRGAHGFHDLFVFGLLETDPRPTFHLSGPGDR